MTRIVGIVLVHNEDLFIEQAIRNVAAFCDRIHVVDHMSTDDTWDIVRMLAREYDHLDVKRARHSGVSHEVLEPYAGTDTWVLRVDGDELYDPAGLAVLQEGLHAGAHHAVFRVLANVLHSVELERGGLSASGYLSPPSRPISALYNFAAVDSWTGCSERLHSGRIVFRPGYDWALVDALYEKFGWDESPLRCLHLCFLPRSKLDVNNAPRGNLGELGTYRRSPLGVAERSLRRLLRRPAGDPRQVAMRARGSSWKQEKYCRGRLLTVDASQFFPQEGA
jgi:glycosyltransferase involved in cell wall biosynthesis